MLLILVWAGQLFTLAREAIPNPNGLSEAPMATVNLPGSGARPARRGARASCSRSRRSAWEVESVLVADPRVREAAAYGVTTPDGQEEVMAALLLELPGADVRAVVRGVAGNLPRVEVHAPIPQDGKATTRTRVAGLHDNGSAAVIVLETEAIGARRRAAVDLEHAHVRAG